MFHGQTVRFVRFRFLFRLGIGFFTFGFFFFFFVVVAVVVTDMVNGFGNGFLDLVTGFWNCVLFIFHVIGFFGVGFLFRSFRLFYFAATGSVQSVLEERLGDL